MVGVATARQGEEEDQCQAGGYHRVWPAWYVGTPPQASTTASLPVTVAQASSSDPSAENSSIGEMSR